MSASLDQRWRERIASEPPAQPEVVERRWRPPAELKDSDGGWIIVLRIVLFFAFILAAYFAVTIIPDLFF